MTKVATVKLTGVLFFHHRVYGIELPWYALVGDTVSWAVSLKAAEIANMCDCREESDTEGVRMHEACAWGLDGWIKRQSKEYLDAYFNPNFKMRIALSPAVVDKDTVEEFLKAIVSGSESTHIEGEVEADFVLDAESVPPVLYYVENVQRYLRHTGNYLKLVVESGEYLKKRVRIRKKNTHYRHNFPAKHDFPENQVSPVERPLDYTLPPHVSKNKTNV